MTVELSEFEPGRDDAEVIGLRGRVWGIDHPHNNPVYFKWLFQDNPAGRGSGVILRRDGQIVGFAGLGSRKMASRGTVDRVAQALDYMVDGAARGGMSGLYGYRLMERWTEVAIAHRYRFGVGFPNANSARLVTSPKLGWRPAFSPVLLVRPFGRLRPPSAAVGGIPPFAAGAALGLLASWSGLARIALARRPAGEAVRIEAFDAAFDALCADMAASPSIGAWRDPACLNWRYVEHPLNAYDRIGWRRAGQMLGFAIVAHREVFGFKAALVVDLAAARESPEVEFALLDEARRRARDAGASLLATLAIEGGPHYRRLLRFGFVPVPRKLDPKPFVLTTHGLGEAAATAMLEKAEWGFSWADMDVV